jgi:hypothetical protein
MKGCEKMKVLRKEDEDWEKGIREDEGALKGGRRG